MVSLRNRVKNNCSINKKTQRCRKGIKSDSRCKLNNKTNRCNKNILIKKKSTKKVEKNLQKLKKNMVVLEKKFIGISGHPRFVRILDVWNTKYSKDNSKYKTFITEYPEWKDGSWIDDFDIRIWNIQVLENRKGTFIMTTEWGKYRKDHKYRISKKEIKNLKIAEKAIKKKKKIFYYEPTKAIAKHLKL